MDSFSSSVDFGGEGVCAASESEQLELTELEETADSWRCWCTSWLGLPESLFRAAAGVSLCLQ